MGHRISWIACRGRPSQEMLDALSLATTGEREEFPDIGWYLLDLAEGGGDGWSLVLAVGTEHFYELEDVQAEALSARGHEALHFVCSDTVLVSQIAAYRDGKWIWSVEYSCENPGDPEIRGDPPSLVHELEQIVREEQRREDEKEAAAPTAFGAADILYGLPAKVGEAITRFNHDPWPQPEEDPFEGMFQPLREAKAG